MHPVSSINSVQKCINNEHISILYVSLWFYLQKLRHIISFHDFLLNQDFTPVGHKTREFGQMTPTFWRNLLLSSSGYKTKCHLFLYPEVPGNRILSDDETYIP